MPEGGEVRRITDQMNAVVSGQTLTGVKIISGRYLKKLPDGLENFRLSLPLKIQEVHCKGKFIYIQTESEYSIWNTLGLTGGWTPSSKVEHIRLAFQFDGVEPVYFYDMRNFGTLKFEISLHRLTEKLASLGPDVLAQEIDDSTFKSRLWRKYDKTLAEVLMDQSIFSGVGNYIKAESLYLAKLSPHRKVRTLSDEEFSVLNRAIRSVILESYKSGGSTFRTYADFNGDVGTFSDRFMVYGRKTDPVGNQVITQETKDKRTTHWVPNVQR